MSGACHQVGLVTNGMSLASGWPILPPGSGPAQLDLIMHTLARVQYRPSEPLTELYTKYAAPRQARIDATSFVLVTAFGHSRTTNWLVEQSFRGARAQCVFVGKEAPEAVPEQVDIFHYPDHFAPLPDTQVPRGQVVYA